MGHELVSDSFSPKERGGEENTTPHFFTYTDRFYAVFPQYLAIGMTYDQFWNDDCLLVKYYREAEKIRTERKNAEMWLQGRYIYEALVDVSPLLHAFAKKGTKASPYPSEPYAITKQAADKKKETEEEAKYIAMKARLISMANKTRKGG